MPSDRARLEALRLNCLWVDYEELTGKLYLDTGPHPLTEEAFYSIIDRAVRERGK